MSKKILCLSVLVFVLAFGSLVAMSHIAVAAYSPAEGDLIKVSHDSAVYYIDASSNRRLFVNEATFWSWYSGSWSGIGAGPETRVIQTLSQEDFDNLSSGEHMRVRPGTNLIKFQNSNAVYAVTPGNKLCRATAQYGDNWQNRLVTIQNGFENDYSNDPTCKVDSSSRLPDGTVYRHGNGSGQLWYVDNGQARIVQDIIANNAFDNNRFQHKFVVDNVPLQMFDGYKDVYNSVIDSEFWINDLPSTTVLLDDLTVSGMWYDNWIEYGGGGQIDVFHFTIVNESGENKEINVGLYIDGGLVQVKSISVIAGTNHSIRWSHPTVGTHEAMMLVDINDDVVESNENNNWSSPLSFTIIEGDLASVECSSKQGETRDECYHELAKTNKDSDLCDLISDTGWKDSCYFLMIDEVSPDMSTCNKIEGADLRSACMANVKMTDGTYSELIIPFAKQLYPDISGSMFDSLYGVCGFTISLRVAGSVAGVLCSRENEDMAEGIFVIENDELTSSYVETLTSNNYIEKSSVSWTLDLNDGSDNIEYNLKNITGDFIESKVLVP